MTSDEFMIILAAGGLLGFLLGWFAAFGLAYELGRAERTGAALRRGPSQGPRASERRKIEPLLLKLPAGSLDNAVPALQRAVATAGRENAEDDEQLDQASQPAASMVRAG